MSRSSCAARPRSDGDRALDARRRPARGPARAAAGRERRRDRGRPCGARSRGARRWAFRSACRRTCRWRSQQGRFDVVHGFEPGLPSLSYLALRDSDALGVATFASPNRLGYPPARSQREKLLARLDALIALTEPARDAAEQRFPGDYRLLSPGVDTTLFAPAPKTNTIVVELRPNERVIARGVMEELHDLPGWEVVLLRTRAADRPARRSRASWRGACHLRTARDGAARAAAAELGGRSSSPASTASPRVRLEAPAAGCALAEPPGRRRRSPSSPQPLPRGWPSTTTLRVAGRRESARRGRASDVRRGRRGARRALLRPRGRSRPPRARRAARRPALDRRRPAHAHHLVARLRGRRRRARRPRRAPRARRDRGHRPQRLRRCARGRRLRRRAAT